LEILHIDEHAIHEESQHAHLHQIAVKHDPLQIFTMSHGASHLSTAQQSETNHRYKQYQCWETVLCQNAQKYIMSVTYLTDSFEEFRSVFSEHVARLKLKARADQRIVHRDAPTEFPVLNP